MDDNQKPSDLVKSQVTVNGELHLDKDMTIALIKWLKASEFHQEEMTENLLSLCETLKPVLGEELHTKLMLQFK